MGKPAAFVVNFNGAKGKLRAQVVSPSGSQEEALVQEVDDGEFGDLLVTKFGVGDFCSVWCCLPHLLGHNDNLARKDVCLGKKLASVQQRGVNFSCMYNK